MKSIPKCPFPLQSPAPGCVWQVRPLCPMGVHGGCSALGLEVVVAGALAGDPGAPAVTGGAGDAWLWMQPWNELGKTLV